MVAVRTRSISGSDSSIFETLTVFLIACSRAAVGQSTPKGLGRQEGAPGIVGPIMVEGGSKLRGKPFGKNEVAAGIVLRGACHGDLITAFFGFTLLRALPPYGTALSPRGGLRLRRRRGTFGGR